MDPLPFLAPSKPAAPKQSSLVAAASRYIAAHEGRRNKPYKDSKGKWTVGIGHLITDDGLKRELTDQEVDELFAKDLAAKESSARAKLGEAFDKLPEQAQVAVLDGFFRGDLSGSPKTLKLLKEGKLEEAADEYLNHAEYKASVASNKAGKPHGVAARMERNAEAFRMSANQGPLKDESPLARKPLFKL